MTSERTVATANEGLELIGLDHPLVRSELSRCRRMEPESLAVCVTGGRDETVLLALLDGGDGKRAK